MAEVTKSAVEQLAEMELEIKRMELEAKKLELLDLRDRIDERKAKRESKGDLARVNGATIAQLADMEKKAQKRCNHKKGGRGAEAVVGGRGNDPNRAILKHIMCSGDTWIRCTRCGKTWKPVLRSWFDFDAQNNPVPEKLAQIAFEKAEAEYETMLEIDTSNTASSSYMFRWNDNGDYFKNMTRYTTLR